MPEPRRIVPDGAVRAGLNTDSAAIPKCRIVRRHTLADSVRLCTAATQQPLGVTMSAVEQNVTVDVQVAGKTIVESGAAITKGALITSDSVGRGVATTTPGDFVIGVADEATISGAGEFIEVTMS